MAERRAQELEMGRIEPQAREEAELLPNHPAFRGNIAPLLTIGAPPHSRGPSPIIPRPYGHPYDPA